MSPSAGEIWRSECPIFGDGNFRVYSQLTYSLIVNTLTTLVILDIIEDWNA